MSVLPAVVLLRSVGIVKESMALPDFLVVGFLAGVDLALVDGDFLLEVLVLVCLMSANLGEFFVLADLLVTALAAFGTLVLALGLVDADLIVASLLTLILVVLVLSLVLELVFFLAVDLLEVDLVSGI